MWRVASLKKTAVTLCRGGGTSRRHSSAALVFDSLRESTGRRRCNCQVSPHETQSPSNSQYVSFSSAPARVSQADDEQELKEKQAAEIRAALDEKTGRLWSDPWDLQDMMESNMNYEDLPEWSPKFVSRISQERVKVLPQKIPTLTEFASLPLPPPPPPPLGKNGNNKLYALQRKRAQYKYILKEVSAMAKDRVKTISELSSWEEKQDAVDELFEEIEFELKAKDDILGKHPNFGTWVERALEEYLRSIQPGKDKTLDDAEKDAPNDSDAEPVFMDCFGQSDNEDDVTPKILSPLRPKERGDTVGNMLEEWELAAHKSTRRIMLRQSSRAIARLLVEEGDHSATRILVSGTRGVGKTAALAAIVASARSSGSIVLYMPDGDQLHKNGFYVEPNAKRQGIYDLPVLSESVCQKFLLSHKSDLAGFEVDKKTLEVYFTDDQLKTLPGDTDAGLSVVDLLEFGAGKTSFAPMCFSASVDVLMKQDEKSFLIVMDEFNCFFEPGHYFHADYDEDVKRPIPYDQISLFQPVLDAMALSVLSPVEAGIDDEEAPKKMPVCMKRGAVIAATTESHAVPRKVTEGLVADALQQASQDDSEVPSIHTIDIPRLSTIEVEHMLANYEATGVGKLRMDRGETVLNAQEVAYLRTVSGGIPQRLLDACIM